MEKPKHPLHLKYPDLQRSPEVAKAVGKKELLGDENVPNDPRERIEAYMDRLEKVFLNKDERVRERNTEMLREHIYDAFIIKRENVPESYFELQQRVARERGERVREIPQEVRERMIDTIVEDQKASLDRWIHYLQSDDAMYPPWFKYLVFRNVVNLSQFDKTLGKFKTRTEHTVAPFPDIFHEPLAQISDLYELVGKDKAAIKDPATKADFEKKFPTLYAELITKSLAAQIEGKEQISGEWVKYEQGENGAAERLFESLQGKGTGWCTAGRSTAEAQIESGDFYVYYTYNDEGKPTQPRVAIRMHGTDSIAEVRGIQEHQQLEPQMQEVLDAKLNEFGNEADSFKKKSADMKRLTEIEKKTKAGEVVSKDDLHFLYEYNSKIEGFGYGRDPRIDEVKKSRDIKVDARILFEKTNAIEHKIEKGEELTADELAYLYEINEPAQGFPQYNDPRWASYMPRFGGDPRIKDMRESRDKLEDARVLFPRMTEIETRILHNENLTKEDLAYLYEVDEEIPRYQHIPDPRIQSLREARDFRSDAAVIMGVKTEELALNKDGVNEKTKMYVGPLYKGIFDDLKTVEHIYTELPTSQNSWKVKEVQRRDMEVGKQIYGDQFIEEFERRGVALGKSVGTMLRSSEVTPSWIREQRRTRVQLAFLSVGDLGLPEDYESISDPGNKIFHKRLKELGLSECDASVGPYLRLDYTDQPEGEKLIVVMDTIALGFGNNCVFTLECGKGGVLTLGRDIPYYYKNARIIVQFG